MEKKLRVPVNPFQRKCEKILFWALIFLAEFHMFACAFREVLPGYSEPFFRVERWIGAVILVALGLYIGSSVGCFPGSLGRFKPLFRRLRSFEQFYMLWMFFWYLAVLIIWQIVKGRSVNLFRQNDWWLFQTALMAFVFFPLPRVLGTKRAKQLIETMLKLVLIPHMLVWGWILLQYFQRNYITFPSGGILGMEPDRSLTFGYNQNITGAGAMIMMALCLYLVATQEKLRKLPYVFGAAVYFSILVLSNCRTSWYCALMIAVCGSFFSVWFGLKEKPRLFRVLVGLLTAGVAVLCLTWLRGELFVLLIDVSYARFPEFAAAEAEMDKAAVENMQVLPTVIESAADYARTADVDAGGLSGRVSLYLACRDVLLSRKSFFFFGVPSCDFAASVFGRHGVDRAFVHAHNFLLTTGMYYGVPTMLLTAAFLISIFIRCFRLLFIHKNPPFRGFWMIPIVLAALVAQDMMESFLSMSAWYLICPSFYLFAGWVVAMDEEAKVHSSMLKVESES